MKILFLLFFLVSCQQLQKEEYNLGDYIKVTRGFYRNCSGPLIADVGLKFTASLKCKKNRKTYYVLTDLYESHIQKLGVL